MGMCGVGIPPYVPKKGRRNEGGQGGEGVWTTTLRVAPGGRRERSQELRKSRSCHRKESDMSVGTGGLGKTVKRYHVKTSSWGGKVQRKTKKENELNSTVGIQEKTRPGSRKGVGKRGKYISLIFKLFHDQQKTTAMRNGGNTLKTG